MKIIIALLSLVILSACGSDLDSPDDPIQTTDQWEVYVDPFNGKEVHCLIPGDIIRWCYVAEGNG